MYQINKINKKTWSDIGLYKKSIGPGGIGSILSLGQKAMHVHYNRENPAAHIDLRKHSTLSKGVFISTGDRGKYRGSCDFGLDYQ